jgi:hypothetical protein
VSPVGEYLQGEVGDEDEGEGLVDVGIGRNVGGHVAVDSHQSRVQEDHQQDKVVVGGVRNDEEKFLPGHPQHSQEALDVYLVFLIFHVDSFEGFFLLEGREGVL